MIIDRARICWLLAADGATAHFYALHTHPLHLEPVLTPPLRNHATERHGQVPEDRKDRFAVYIAEAIADAAAKKLFQDLVIAAPPRMLGDLRNHLDPAVHKLVRLEIGSEWANMTPTEIAKHLQPHLSPAAQA